MHKKLTVTTDAFNTRCAELLELVRSQNTVIEIKHAGTLVAKLVPADHKKLFGALKGSVTTMMTSFDRLRRSGRTIPKPIS